MRANDWLESWRWTWVNRLTERDARRAKAAMAAVLADTIFEADKPSWGELVPV